MTRRAAPLWTPAFARLVAPARRGVASWPRTIAGVILVILVGLPLVFVLAVILHNVLVLLRGGFVGAAAGAAFEDGFTTPESMTAVMLAAGAMLPVLALAMRVLHRRRLTDLLGPAPMRGVAVGAFVGLVVHALILVPLLDAVPATHAPAAAVISLLPLALLGLLTQAAATVLFHAYVQTQIAARVRAAWAWMLLPAVPPAALASLVGLSPEPGAAALAVGTAVEAFVFGLVVADLIRVTGGAGLATGLGTAGATVATFFAAPSDTMNGLARLTLDATEAEIYADPALLALRLGPLVVGWAALRMILARHDRQVPAA